MDFAAFAAARRDRLVAADEEIESLVRQALARWGAANWPEPIVTGASVLFLEILERENPSAPAESYLPAFQRELTETLLLTKRPDPLEREAQVDRITKWVGTYSVNSATYFAARGVAGRKVWLSMDDDDVRPAHREADGQSVPLTARFDVAGFKLRFPGEPVGPPEVWINCRCLIAADARGEASMDPETFEVAPGLDREPDDEMEELPEGEALVDDIDEIPVSGVLAPTGVMSGDGRMFREGSADFRDLPLPIRFETMSGPNGHDNAVVVGRIDRAWMEGNLMAWDGFLNPNARFVDEVVDGIVFGMYRGVSIDADDVEIEMPDQDDPEIQKQMANGSLPTVFSRVRVAAVTIVPIPAFQEAYIKLGSWEDNLRTEATDDVPEDDEESMVASAAPEGARTEAKRGLAWVEEGKAGSGLEPATVERARKIAAGDDLTDEHIARMRSFFARHEVDKKGKGWSPDEDGYPSAGRVAWALWGGDAGKSFADAEFKRIERERAASLDPDAFDAAAAQLITVGNILREISDASLLASATFAPGTKDGPGWLTNPRATARIRRYWTRGKGAAKIRWGVPGDFNRCRRQLGKYVNPAFLAGTCANMHKEALGVWPGRERGNFDSEHAPAMSIVAAAVDRLVEASWFHDPELAGPTAITVTDEGRIFGHLATWGTCHIGFEGVCTTPPASKTNYALFRLGAIDTTEGEMAVGQITLGTGHAALKAGARAAAAHYDNTGLAVADVAAGEDAFGIWVAGSIRAGLTDEEMRELKGAKLSGDWRRVGGNLELVAALAVNVPGFPVPRTALAASGGHQDTLIASGIVEDSMAHTGKVEVELNVDQAVGLVAAVADELEYRQEKRTRIAAARQAYDAELAERQQARAARAAQAKSLIEA